MRERRNSAEKLEVNDFDSNMLSQNRKQSELLNLLKSDSTTQKVKNKNNKEDDEFGKIDNWMHIIFIYAFVAFIFITGFIKLKHLSDEILTDSDYHEHRLQNGWILGRKIDLTDHQFRKYRSSFSIHFSFAIAFIIASKLCKFSICRYFKHYLFTWRQTDTINHRKLSQITTYQTAFYCIIGGCFILYLHGPPCILMLAFLFLNYCMAKTCQKTKYFVLITWTLNLSLAFIAFRFDQFVEPKHIFPSFFNSLFPTQLHWNQSYRFCILRCISFNLDFYYFLHKRTIYKSRFNHSDFLQFDDFSLINYFGYLLYTPLELMGPIIGFHEFIIQNKLKIISTNKHAKELKFKSVSIYFCRFVILWILHEVMLHFYYMHYLQRYGYPKNIEMKSDYLILLALVSYMHLKLIWIKFSIIWKFSRLWALCDEIVTIENMQRCISNTTSVLEFWRYWHSSFNVFNLRYIYIPMGGTKKNRFLNTLVVFLFVFLWHGDFNLSLLYWSLFMFIGFIPEILAKQFIKTDNLCVVSVGAAANIMILIIVNNIGFGGGLDRMMHALGQFYVKPWTGIPIFVFCYFCLVLTAMLMYHTRYLKRKYSS